MDIMKRIPALFGVLLIVLATLAPAQASATDAPTFAELRHLLSRTGFGLPNEDQIIAFQGISYTEAVEHLLVTANTVARTPVPAWSKERPPTAKVRKSWNPEQRKVFKKLRKANGQELKRWWLREMVQTPSPLSERMTLFWHNHFVSSLKKVKSPQLMLSQNQLLRRHAIGNFADLLHAIAVNPAMLIYLDGQNNRKKNPNENFAREVMELFTLGENNGYGEQDIREAARAFTGWAVDRKTGAFIFRKKHHDNSSKTFLGHRGAFDGKNIIDILLAQRRVSEHISAKLWLAFVGAPANRATIKNLAYQFRQSDYDIPTLLRTVLLSPEFRAPETRGNMIKAPVDLIVGPIRFFGADRIELNKVPQVLKSLGQDLFNPPNVKGWPGGRAWVTTGSLATRNQFLKRVVRGLNKRADGSMMMTSYGGQRERPLHHFLLALDPVTETAATNPLARISRLIVDPVFQVK
jgi:uncharacterized protein (DUF1800 family)